jgi:hypothetical protein
MNKIFILLISIFLLSGCASGVALIGPATGAANGKIAQSTLKSAVSYGIKKQTGKSPLEHALAYAGEKNPNNKKEKCISFIEKTNSIVCAVINKNISEKKKIIMDKPSIQSLTNVSIYSNIKDSIGRFKFQDFSSRITFFERKKTVAKSEIEKLAFNSNLYNRR